AAKLVALITSLSVVILLVSTLCVSEASMKIVIIGWICVISTTLAFASPLAIL
ncbi:Unknown protein, partial [Striga hermonthica]